MGKQGYQLWSFKADFKKTKTISDVSKYSFLKGGKQKPSCINSTVIKIASLNLLLI